MAVDTIIKQVIEKTNLSDEQKSDLLEKIESALRFEFGGLSVYINSKQRIDAQQLKKEFNGRNIDALATRYGVNRATVYRNLNE